MSAVQPMDENDRYSRSIQASKRIRWDIDRDVLRGRHFDPAHTFMPAGLSEVHRLPFLDANEARLMSQVQGRTYANMFGMIERFIGAKMLEIGREHALADQTALEAIVRFLAILERPAAVDHGIAPVEPNSAALVTGARVRPAPKFR